MKTFKLENGFVCTYVDGTSVAVRPATELEQQQDARIRELEGDPVAVLETVLLLRGSFDDTQKDIKVGDVFKFKGSQLFYGEPVEFGDMVIANKDNPSERGDWTLLTAESQGFGTNTIATGVGVGPIAADASFGTDMHSVGVMTPAPKL